jgi:hypothetical protein
MAQPKHPPGPLMTLGGKGLCLAALAVTLHFVTACSDYERFHGRTPEQVKQACDPQRQTREECSRTFINDPRALTGLDQCQEPGRATRKPRPAGGRPRGQPRPGDAAPGVP